MLHQNAKTVVISQFELINLVYKSKLFGKINLKPTAKLVLYALIHHYNPLNEDMFPSQRYIAQNLGISEKSVERAVKELADNRLIMYVTKNVNRYKFTQTFFELVTLHSAARPESRTPLVNEQEGKFCKRNYPKDTVSFVKMSDDFGQNVGSNHRQNVGQTYNHEHKKNKGISFISSFTTPANSMNPHVSVEKTKKMLDKLEEDRKINFTPKDFSKEDALKWLKNLPPELHGGILAREVYKKYGFNMPENVKNALILRGKLPETAC